MGLMQTLLPSMFFWEVNHMCKLAMSSNQIIVACGLFYEIVLKETKDLLDPLKTLVYI